MMSLPVNDARTSAGRRLEALRSEKGNGTTTTSPFTNWPMLPLLQADPSLYATCLLKQVPSLYATCLLKQALFDMLRRTIADLPDTIRSRILPPIFPVVIAEA